MRDTASETLALPYEEALASFSSTFDFKTRDSCSSSFQPFSLSAFQLFSIYLLPLPQ